MDHQSRSLRHLRPGVQRGITERLRYLCHLWQADAAVGLYDADGRVDPQPADRRDRPQAQSLSAGAALSEREWTDGVLHTQLGCEYTRQPRLMREARPRPRYVRGFHPSRRDHQHGRRGGHHHDHDSCHRSYAGDTGILPRGDLTLVSVCACRLRQLGRYRRLAAADSDGMLAVRYFRRDLDAGRRCGLYNRRNPGQHGNRDQLLRRRALHRHSGVCTLEKAGQTAARLYGETEEKGVTDKGDDGMLTDSMKWTREPADYTITPDKIKITTEPHTDLWQRTYYRFRNDNAPVLQAQTDEQYFSFVVHTDFSGSHHRFDQCGIVMYLDSENWLKASVEYENGEIQHLGSVVTDGGYSDSATAEIPASVTSMWYRLSRREDDFRIECSVRICHMSQATGTIRFGVYACSPEDSSFTAVFTDMALTECMWQAHDGQQPD